MSAAFPPRWSWRTFGVFEPLTCLMAGLMISVPPGDSAVLHSLFPAAVRAASQAADPKSRWTYAVLGVAAVHDPAAVAITVTLLRMYGSALICFGIAQHFFWRECILAASGGESKSRLRAWAGLMLVPAMHHLLYAYGPYAVGPYAEWDEACYLHHILQLVLILGRLTLLASTSSGKSYRAGVRRLQQVVSRLAAKALRAQPTAAGVAANPARRIGRSPSKSPPKPAPKASPQAPSQAVAFQSISQAAASQAVASRAVASRAAFSASKITPAVVGLGAGCRSWCTGAARGGLGL